ncbi:Stp1/IreP family PP2C-type Ser/Thr phosphatase [Undibacterium arcticum]|uniref:Stp1/IreP family PP2C-type Ser/Thr phosphatase n=1 Tax=Undibacterium arcticum TaxID=1762892 RepID=A0ABV7EWY7_9BURK
MTHTVKLEMAAASDVGLIRTHNEDSIAFSAEVSPGCGFAILADGMGGYNAGEVASAMATSIVRDALQHHLQPLRSAQSAPAPIPMPVRHLWLSEAIEAANAAILQAALKEPQYRGMGTTIVVALLRGDLLTLAHVGDSRGYRYRGGRLEQLTRDHSLLQQQIDAGLITPESAPFYHHKNIITRAVGVDHLVQSELHDIPIEPGDIYVLCSDGLSDMLTAAQIGTVLMGCAGGADLDDACKTLIDEANAHGGHDNISVILIKILA